MSILNRVPGNTIQVSSETLLHRTTKSRLCIECLEHSGEGYTVRRQKLWDQLGPWAKLHFRVQFTREFQVPTAQIVAQPLLDGALFLFLPPA